MKILRILDATIPKILRAVALIGGLTVVVMTILITREVIGRYFFNAPSPWSVELCEHLMVVFTFLGGPYVLVLNAHVRADFFYQKVTGKSKTILDLIIYSFTIIYLGILTWMSFLYSGQLLAKWTTSSGGLDLPLFPAQATVTIGAFLISVECLRKIIHSIMQLSGGHD